VPRPARRWPCGGSPPRRQQRLVLVVHRVSCPASSLGLLAPPTRGRSACRLRSRSHRSTQATARRFRDSRSERRGRAKQFSLVDGDPTGTSLSAGGLLAPVARQPYSSIHQIRHRFGWLVGFFAAIVAQQTQRRRVATEDQPRRRSRREFSAGAALVAATGSSRAPGAGDPQSK